MINCLLLICRYFKITAGAVIVCFFSKESVMRLIALFAVVFAVVLGAASSAEAGCHRQRCGQRCGQHRHHRKCCSVVVPTLNQTV